MVRDHVALYYENTADRTDDYGKGLHAAYGVVLGLFDNDDEDKANSDPEVAASPVPPHEERRCYNCKTSAPKDDDEKWLCERCSGFYEFVNGGMVARTNRAASPVRGAAHPPEGPSDDGVALIAAERLRQINAEGWTPYHDDGHRYAELAIAAAMLAVDGTDAHVESPDGPSWGLPEKHRGDRVRQLTIAGALIAAEIDRLKRSRSDSTPAARGAAPQDGD